MKHMRFRPLFCALLAASAICLSGVRSSAAEISPTDAEEVLQDTLTLDVYVGIRDENDFRGKPQNVIKAALFGAFDAKMKFLYEQAMLREKGLKTASADSTLFSVDGRALSADQVVSNDEKPEIFRSLPKPGGEGPDQYTHFIGKQAVELAALRFTGHKISHHAAPDDSVLMTEKGYFVVIDGLGDSGREAKIEHISPQGEGCILSGKIENLFDDGKARFEDFTLQLVPGDAPGTWKRISFAQGTKRTQ